MLIVSRDGSKRSAALRGARWGLGLVSLVAAFGAACSDDDDASGGQCIGGDGAVAGQASTHCIDSTGMQLRAPIGMCATGVSGEEEEEHEHEEGEAGDAGAEAEEHEHEEGEDDHPILFGREADDDNCKYHVSFENTCVAVNEPVTFTLHLTRLIDGNPGTGTVPSNPEIFLADNPSIISLSNSITAPEVSPGVYEIGPVVFQQSGRWVVRFHYFDTCSEAPEDSPHSHVAFYIDVP